MPPTARNDNRLLSPDVLAGIQGLELRARRIVEGYVSGMHRSPHHGFSHEFAEHRQYTPGDDLRHIDWKVFGRTDKFYLKRFEEETNLICYLVLDVSRSMTYRSEAAAMNKLDYARTVAASLSYLVLGQQDSIMLVTGDDQVRTMTQPGGGRAKLGEVVQVLDEIDILPLKESGLPPSGGEYQPLDSSRIYHELAQRFRRRGIVVVLSDLMDGPERLTGALRHFLHRRHELVLCHVLDPYELDFPFDRLTSFRDLETMSEVTADARAVAIEYRRQIERHQRLLHSFCTTHKADYVPLRTDRPVDAALTGYLTARSHRVTNE